MWKLCSYLYSVFLVGGTQNSDGKNFGGFLEIFSQEFWELGNIRKVKSLKLNYQNVRWNSLECKGWLRDPQRIVHQISVCTSCPMAVIRIAKFYTQLCMEVNSNLNMGKTIFNIRSEITWKYPEIVTRPHHKSQCIN